MEFWLTHNLSRDSIEMQNMKMNLFCIFTKGDKWWQKKFRGKFWATHDIFDNFQLKCHTWPAHKSQKLRLSSTTGYLPFLQDIE